MTETTSPKPAPTTDGGFAFVFVTVAIDMLALGLIIPVLPNLVNQMTGGDISQASKYVGTFSVGWAIMQFIFMPILGTWSDQIGRKPIFLISNFGQAFANILTAIAPSFPLLFISRLLSGVSSAVISTANAYIADSYAPDQRAAKFGMLGAAFGLGFILGPAVGGYLGKIDLQLPFYVAAAMAFFNGIYGWIMLKESLPKQDRTPFKWAKANPIGSFGFLRERPKVLILSIVKGLCELAFAVYPAIFVLYGLFRYGWNTDVSGITLGVVGILATLVQLFLVSPVIKRFGEMRTMIFGATACALGMALYGLAPSAIWFWAAMPIAALIGFLNPSVMGLLSREIGAHEQGRLQGALGAVQAGTAIIGPMVYNPLFAWSIATDRAILFPGSGFMFAALCAFLAMGIAIVSLSRADRARANAA